MADKKVMKRRSAPPRVEDEDGQVPARATGPSKKVAGPRAAPSKRPAPREAAPASRRVRDDDDDEDDGRELRSGWSAAQETIDATSPWAATFVPGTEMQIVKFLEESPYASYQRHWIQRVGTGRRPYTCLESWGRPCPLCGVGDRAGAVAAFNVAVVGDDGEAVHKSWDCAVKVTQIL